MSRQVGTGLSLTSNSPDGAPSTGAPPGRADRRRRVRGALLLAACADAIHACGTSATGNGAATPGGELRYGPRIDQVLHVAHLLAGHAGAMEEADLAALIGRGPRGGGDPAGWAWPVGLLASCAATRAASLARRIAVAAGADQVSADCAAAQSIAVHAASHHPDHQPLTADTLITAAGMHATTPALREALQLVRALTRHHLTTAEMLDQLSHRRPVITATAASFSAALLHPADPTGTVHTARSLAPATGGDAAVMAAAITGAHLGEDHVPPRWGQTLRGAATVHTAATRLADHP